MKEGGKQFLVELRALLEKHDMSIGFDCDSVESVYGDHLEIRRRSDDKIVFRTENGEWVIGCFNLPTKG